MGIISRVGTIDEPLMLYRRHDAHAGNDPQLNDRAMRTIQQMYRNLSLQAYQRDVQRWEDMLRRLESLRRLAVGVDRW